MNSLALRYACRPVPRAGRVCWYLVGAAITLVALFWTTPTH